MRIQNNIPSMKTYRFLTGNRAAIQSSLEKLASGYQINRAADDAAGLAVSEKMRMQITGLSTALKNCKDVSSLLQTAEGGLTELHEMLNRALTLAEQSANGTYDDSTDRAQLQKELENLCTEIDRIATATNFNGIELLHTDHADPAVNAAAARSGTVTGLEDTQSPVAGGGLRTAREAPAVKTAAAKSETVTDLEDAQSPVAEEAPRTVSEALTLDSPAPVRRMLRAASARATATYLDATGNIQTRTDAIELDSTVTSLNSGWYLVSGDVTFSSRLTISGDVHLILADGCTLKAENGGIDVADGKSLTVYAQSSSDDIGKIIAQGEKNHAGIGSGQNVNSGSITINGGTVTATGGEYGAGIGGGDYGSGSNITVNGGTVTATGGRAGAGIGGGNQRSGSNITVSGGTVITTGGSSGAGIGGGYGGDGKDITVSGGTVIATGVNGAGIGGGSSGDGSGITISDGTVTATGGSNAAGIGGGNFSGKGSNITVSGGTVTATGGGAGAGIGGGNNGDGSDIAVSDGTVTATGGNNAAGIGGGDNGDGSKITVSGGTVTAIGGKAGTGIGGGVNGTGDEITVSGGTVTATGGNYAAGIGGGKYKSGSNITISGGIVSAKGGDGGENIGSGNGASSTSNVANRSGGLIFEGDNNGKLYGDMELTEDYIIDAGVTVTIGSGCTLTVGNGVTLTNNGTICIEDGGKLEGNGTIDGSGTIKTLVTLTLKLNGGTLNSSTGDQSVSTDTGQTYSSLTAPTRTGYTFKGWSTDNDPNNLVNGSDNISNSVTTLYAIWEANKYTVTIDDGNGGTSTQQVTHGDTYSSLTAPTRTGYTFKGWSTDNDPSNLVNTGDSITSDQTLYAHWTANQYTVTLNHCLI